MRATTWTVDTVLIGILTHVDGNNSTTGMCWKIFHIKATNDKHCVCACVCVCVQVPGVRANPSHRASRTWVSMGSTCWNWSVKSQNPGVHGWSKYLLLVKFTLQDLSQRSFDMLYRKSTIEVFYLSVSIFCRFRTFSANKLLLLERSTSDITDFRQRCSRETYIRGQTFRQLAVVVGNKYHQVTLKSYSSYFYNDPLTHSDVLVITANQFLFLPSLPKVPVGVSGTQWDQSFEYRQRGCCFRDKIVHLNLIQMFQ